MEDVHLHFKGPFTFTGGPGCVFESSIGNSAGVYLWTIPQDEDGSHLVCYVGESKQIAGRQREHLTNMLGLNYRIIDSDKARNGVCEIVWPGMWRDRSSSGPVRAIAEYSNLNGQVVSHIAAHRIFIAETTLETQLRKHVEGCIGWNLRKRHPQHKVLYPDDNHVGAMRDRDRGYIRITSDEVIRGLDPAIAY